MDDIVRQALAKWPAVPDCYGWLGLDGRGHWRMRDARAQQLNLPGDQIAHTALNAFIARNYSHDAGGRWFFQNGPQRVYVRLEATPYIARSDPAHGYALHTGAPLAAPDGVVLCPSGELILQYGDIVAQLDDRDVGTALEALEMDGRPLADEALLDWLDGGAGALTLRHGGGAIPVRRIAHAQLGAHFGFEPQPAPL